MTGPEHHPADDDPLVAAIRGRLEAEVRDLDWPTQRRLAAARRRALSKVRPHRAWVWAPRLALAGVALVAVGIALRPGVAPQTRIHAAPPEVLEALGQGMPVEAVDDLDFYEWVAAGGDHAG